MSDDRDRFERLFGRRLQAHENRAPAGEAPDIPGRRETRGWLVAGVLGAGALAAASVLAVMFLQRPVPPVGNASPTASPSESAVPTETAASPTAMPTTPADTPTPSPVPPELEVVLRIGDDESISSVSGIADFGDRLFAAVNTMPTPFVPPVGPPGYSAEIYASDGAGDWQRLDTGDTFAHTNIQHLFSPAGGSLVAYGYVFDFDRPQDEGYRAWTSTDGEVWSPIDGLPPFPNVAEGALGYAIAGGRPTATFDERILELYWSEDAIEWELTYSETRPRGASFRMVSAGPEGFVAVGNRATGDETEPFTLASSDGRTWFEAPQQSALQPGDFLTAVAPIGTDWVAAGFSRDGELPTWWSANGLDWERAAMITDPAAHEYFGHPAHVVSTGDAVLLSAALSVEGSDSRPVAVWISTDGRNWRITDLGAEAEVRATAAWGCCHLLGGRLGDQRGDAVIWRVNEAWLD